MAAEGWLRATAMQLINTLMSNSHQWRPYWMSASAHELLADSILPTTQ